MILDKVNLYILILWCSENRLQNGSARNYDLYQWCRTQYCEQEAHFFHEHQFYFLSAALRPFRDCSILSLSLWQKGNFLQITTFQLTTSHLKKRVFRSVLVGFTNRLNVKIYLTFWHHYTIVCVWSLLPKGAIFLCPKCYTNRYRTGANRTAPFKFPSRVFWWRFY